MAEPRFETELERELFGTLRRLRLTTVLLQAHAVGCIANHHKHDVGADGLPGWLKDAAADIDVAGATLIKARGDTNA